MQLLKVQVGKGGCGEPDTIPLKKETKPVETSAISLAAAVYARALSASLGEASATRTITAAASLARPPANNACA